MAGPPKIAGGLQGMLDQASTQRKAEVLATRLALLKQQETRVTGETEETRRRLEELALRKEVQERRIREKTEALREMHRADACYQAHAHKKAQALPPVGEDDALAQLSRQAAAQGSPQQAETPRQGLSSQDPFTASLPMARESLSARPGVSSQSLAQSPRVFSGQSARLLSSRLQTSDIVDLAHAQVASKKDLPTNRREKARLGAYVNACERVWMSPRLGPGANSQSPKAKSLARKERDATIPGKISEMDPKELVEKMAKKELELKARVESARKAQILADSELESGFKSFFAMQVSARKAIREGEY